MYQPGRKEPAALLGGGLVTQDQYGFACMWPACCCSVAATLAFLLYSSLPPCLPSSPAAPLLAEMEKHLVSVLAPVSVESMLPVSPHFLTPREETNSSFPVIDSVSLLGWEDSQGIVSSSDG